MVTASAGNHGLGVARAAALLGRPATVVVPETLRRPKSTRCAHSGAELVLVGRTYDEAEAAALVLARERGLPFVSAYNDAAVVAGGGTIALEILATCPRYETLVVPGRRRWPDRWHRHRGRTGAPRVRVLACSPRPRPRCTPR